MKTKQFNDNINPSNSQNEEKIALVVTFGVHALLLLLFVFFNVSWHYEPSEWVEMDIIAVKSKPARKTSKQYTPPVQTQPEKKKSNQLQINLPKRKMLEDDNDPIKRSRRDLQMQDEFQVPVREEQKIDRHEIDPLQQNETGIRKETADLSEIQSGEKKLNFEEQDFGKGVTIPFQIEGEVADRSVLHKVIPEYPSGLRKEAVVKLRFSVLPSGVVSNILPVHKGSAELERVAVEAFQQWRFDALPATVEQRVQNGMITFNFVMR